ncbi:MAG: hypothetical protein IKB56_06385 [Clostridia bacterium]|nr:hypothetical protein [Clostridia bacterium]
MFPIYDIHSHVLFNLDDGAINLDTSIEMLSLMIKQGVTDVFCTSHDGFYQDEYDSRFITLEKRVAELGLAINLHKGCEIYCECNYVDEIIGGIKDGSLSPLGNSNHYLIEFSPYESKDNILKSVKRIIDRTGINVIIAHVERCFNLATDMHAVRVLEDYGAKFQVNAYSFAEETNTLIRTFALMLLNAKLVYFIGSDAHHITHRPPRLTQGVNLILSKCDEDYAKDILFRNAQKYLF